MTRVQVVHMGRAPGVRPGAADGVLRVGLLTCTGRCQHHTAAHPYSGGAYIAVSVSMWLSMK